MSESDFRRPTGRDVAALAGVSQSAVSLVFSGKAEGRVSPDVQSRVRDAARQLGYRPHVSASTLRIGRARSVGLIVPDITNPFVGHVMRGAQDTAHSEAYTVVLIEPGDQHDWQVTAMDSLNAAAIDGLMLFAIEPPSASQEHGLGPLVLLETTRAGLSSVRLDVEGGVALAMAHLVDLGHRTIAHLATNLPASTFARRSRAWRAELRRHGLDDLGAIEVWCDFTLAAARETAADLLVRRPEVTAVLCDDDLLAAGAMLAAHDQAIEVPGRLSIVGFAGSVLSEAATPQITTVHGPAEQLGGLAMELMLRQVGGEPGVEARVLPMTLIERSSTGPPPKPGAEPSSKG